MLLRVGDSATRSVAHDAGATHHEPVLRAQDHLDVRAGEQSANLMRVDG